MKRHEALPLILMFVFVFVASNPVFDLQNCSRRANIKGKYKKEMRTWKKNEKLKLPILHNMFFLNLHFAEISCQALRIALGNWS